MFYPLLRAVAGVALHWYYADVIVQGRERIPARGALLVVANHPNALVDALVVSSAMERRILLTAKATLFEQPFLAALLHAVGVIPLRRAQDERAGGRTGRVSVSRNTDAFRAVITALLQGRAVLVFPEGISHDAPALAPLKTGAARMALAAFDAGAGGLRILPLGLIFERKERPRSRVLVRVGMPIEVARWRASAAQDDATRLTAEVDAALRQVTVNFASEARAHRAVELARTLAAIADAPASLDRPRDLATEAELARRIESATDALSEAPPDVARQVDRFVSRVEALEARLAARHASLDDMRISPRIRHALRFLVRESLVCVLALPMAMLGRITHAIPLRLARALALRPLARDPSRDQPAMRTIILGLCFVLLAYVLQGALVAHWFGPFVATAWLVTIFLAARVDFLLRDRLRRAWRRARTYLALRRDPVFRDDALSEMRDLLTEALSLEQALAAVAVPAR